MEFVNFHDFFPLVTLKIGQGHPLSNLTEIFMRYICGANMVILATFFQELSHGQGFCRTDGRTDGRRVFPCPPPAPSAATGDKNWCSGFSFQCANSVECPASGCSLCPHSSHLQEATKDLPVPIGLSPLVFPPPSCSMTNPAMALIHNL